MEELGTGRTRVWSWALLVVAVVMHEVALEREDTGWLVLMPLAQLLLAGLVVGPLARLSRRDPQPRMPRAGLLLAFAVWIGVLVGSVVGLTRGFDALGLPVPAVLAGLVLIGSAAAATGPFDRLKARLGARPVPAPRAGPRPDVRLEGASLNELSPADALAEIERTRDISLRPLGIPLWSWPLTILALMLVETAVGQDDLLPALAYGALLIPLFALVLVLAVRRTPQIRRPLPGMPLTARLAGMAWIFVALFCVQALPGAFSALRAPLPAVLTYLVTTALVMVIASPLGRLENRLRTRAKTPA
ncbi:hypothetical protein [Actinocorallia longicatena]|uniref:Uncharacterized protein n=1 Tax=Actinocorallia longicatena TaxID=111803 RepID=A0ABP6Q8B6_9ACTN